MASRERSSQTQLAWTASPRERRARRRAEHGLVDEGDLPDGPPPQGGEGGEEAEPAEADSGREGVESPQDRAAMSGKDGFEGWGVAGEDRGEAGEVAVGEGALHVDDESGASVHGGEAVVEGGPATRTVSAAEGAVPDPEDIELDPADPGGEGEPDALGGVLKVAGDGTAVGDADHGQGCRSVTSPGWHSRP